MEMGTVGSEACSASRRGLARWAATTMIVARTARPQMRATPILTRRRTLARDMSLSVYGVSSINTDE